MVKDRRAFQRIDGIVNVRYGVKDRDKEKIETLPRDIGGGGLGLCITEELQRGTILDLEITLPDNPEKTILGAGEVKWSKEFGAIDLKRSINLYETGIRFININSIAIGRVYAYSRQKKADNPAKL